MAKYAVTVDISDAHGWQQFLVEADSPEAAIEKWKAGGSDEFLAEEIEVTDLDHHSAIAELHEEAEAPKPYALEIDDIGDLEDIRQRMGLSADDTSADAQILAMEPMERVRLIAGWNLGSPGWADEFKAWCGGQGLYLTTNADDPDVVV